ncbi:hypothetical protein OG992_18840 [Micromonospora sp. NBC_00362]|uniref:hypothetical protein n=1 Tax=Micromonospora sp. NBC_00362 TaxID=2975975 RepID=UPI002251BAFA|nr:hypothetical protein [Micromonospora sp. NBC_00362]MCX5119247.1 hypothetical protein [Micromonospora sp. NBC_00362]
MSAVIRANGFDRFRLALADAADEQVAATQAYWEGLTGFIAATHRDLVDHEIEYRQAVTRLNAAGPDLVAAISLPTRWEAKR